MQGIIYARQYLRAAQSFPVRCVLQNQFQIIRDFYIAYYYFVFLISVIRVSISFNSRAAMPAIPVPYEPHPSAQSYIQISRCLPVLQSDIVWVYHSFL